MGQHRVVAEEQGTAEGEVDPVVPLAEGGEEGVGVGRARGRSRRRRWCRCRVAASFGVQVCGGIAHSVAPAP